MYEYKNGDTLILKEYGRNVQKLVDYLLTIQDKAKRTKLAHALVELMRQIHPTYKEQIDSQSKLWDDLYIMSKFRLDIDAPYPMPEPTAIGKKPQKVAYSNNRIRYRHYGKNVELLIEQACALQNEEERKAAIIHIGRLMKGFYMTWNKDNVEDDLILEQIKELSDNQLMIDIAEVRAHGYFDSQVKKVSNGQNRNNKKMKNNLNKKKRKR